MPVLLELDEVGGRRRRLRRQWLVELFDVGHAHLRQAADLGLADRAAGHGA